MTKYIIQPIAQGIDNAYVHSIEIEAESLDKAKASFLIAYSWPNFEVVAA